ncbi:MAG: septum formation initiator family protein [Atopobiaceae bacterium]
MPRSFGRSTGDAGKTGSLPRLRVSETGNTSQAGWRPAVFVGPNSRGVRLSGDGDAFRKVGNDSLRRRSSQSQRNAVQAEPMPMPAETQDPQNLTVQERQEARRRRREQREGIAAPVSEARSGRGRTADKATTVLGSHKALVIVAVIAAVILSLYGPVRNWYMAQRRTQDLEAQYAQLNSANSTLSDEVSSLQTQEGIEDEARKHGYVAEGETPVTITGDGSEVTDSSSDGSDSTSDTISGTSTAQAETDDLTKFLDGLFQYKFEE